MDFCIFWQNPEWPRWLHTKEALLRWVKADFQITALSETGRRFDPSICNWRRDCFQHWPSYHTTRRKRDEPFRPALILTLLPKPVGLGSQSFGLENDNFLLKKRLFRKLLPNTTGGIWTGAGNTSTPKGQACPSKKTFPSTREESSAFKALILEPVRIIQHSLVPFHHKTICTLLKCCHLG